MLAIPTLQPTDFNIVCAVLGGFVLLFGLVSYIVKERLYLSESLIALLIGVAFGPYAANLIKPLAYTPSDKPEEIESVTLAFTRLVLGVQLVLAGVQLPKKYLLTEWRSLAMLLGPVMVAMWVCSSILVWGLLHTHGVGVLGAMAIAACITPTDPILANAIVKGKFADAHIPVPLQRIITAESGANDGLGYPFLFLPLYLLAHQSDPVTAGKFWVANTIFYVVLLSVVYGALIGWAAKALLHYSSAHGFVDRESFLVFAIALALFIVGTAGVLGTDDVLACFIAGNVFTFDDWFRLETLDDSLQPTIDMLLNLSIFLWFGAVCPWHLFTWRIVGLAILVLLLRRPPVVLGVWRAVPRIATIREAVFAGYFGPIGVSAVFYLYVATEFLAVGVEGGEALAETMRAVVWTCVVASVVVHGVTIPVAKLGTEAGISVSRLSTISISRGRTNGPNVLDGLGTIIPSRPMDLAEEGRVDILIPPQAAALPGKRAEVEGEAARGEGPRLQFVDRLDGVQTQEQGGQ